MAKQINFTHPDTGANYPDAYFRVQQCDITRDSAHSVGVIYYGYANKQAALDNKQLIFSKRTEIVSFNVQATDDFRALIYTQESDSFFDGSIDV